MLPHQDITTDDRAKMPMAEHVAFDEHHALDVAKKIPPDGHRQLSEPRARC